MLRVRVDLSVVVDVKDSEVSGDGSIDDAVLRARATDAVCLYNDFVVTDYEVAGEVVDVAPPRRVLP